MRAVRSSIAAALSCGTGVGACTVGQPSTQPTAITRVAATAPEIGAIAQGETGLEAGREIGSEADAGEGPDGS